VQSPHAGAANQYWLRRHVFLCTTSDGVVFLDTRRDRYFALSGLQLSALAQTVTGWPSLGEPSTLSPDEAQHIADEYVHAGLITPDPLSGKNATPVALHLKTGLKAIAPEHRMQRRITPLDLMNFLIACVSAAVALRVRSLESVVNLAAWNKSRGPCSAGHFDEPRVIELVGIFRKLRVLSFSGRGRCLFQALALIYFLGRYNQFPTWVIGVRIHPWGAHSWVQRGNIVLDATPELVRFYTPIVAV
jgi:hypothetical protein